MTADLVMRTAAVLACAATLSLFSTIVAYAAVNVAPLKWDGSFCAGRECVSAVAVLDDSVRIRSRVASREARAS